MRLIKINVISSVVLALIFDLVSFAPAFATNIPTDPGRLSLIQAEHGTVVNQRDGSQVLSDSFSLLSGRTLLRQAVNVSNTTHIMRLPTQNNIDLSHGSLAFWTLKSNWSDVQDDWFFRLNVSSSYVPNDDLQVRKFSNGNIYAGFEFVRAVAPAASLNASLWHNFVLTWDAGTTVKLYIDGVLVSEGPQYDGSAVVDTNLGGCEVICWGGWLGFSSARAVMEDMQTFNYPLSAQQVSDIYNSFSPAVFYNDNVAPSVGLISVSMNPIQVNTAIVASASFTDPGALDTHVAVWDWGDGTITNGTVTETNGSGSVSNSHTYRVAGVHEIILTVTDNNSGVGTQIFQYLSVYSPTAQGLFSAGQKFISQYPNLSGNAKFGLSYKYKGDVPVSNRQFSMEIQSANFVFNATTISSFVVANGIGVLRGTGTVNGQGTYNFLVVGSDGANTIRIKITNQSNTVVFDTQPGAADTIDSTTSVIGNVLVH